MKKRCEDCGKLSDREDLKQCQSAKCRPKGEIFCEECISQHGSGFHAPFYCNQCHPNKSKRKKSEKTQDARKKPDEMLKMRSGPHKRLCRLRFVLQLKQRDMANVIGVSRRSYQFWEADPDWEDPDKSQMTNLAKVSCWHLASALAPELCEDWPEGEPRKALIESRTKPQIVKCQKCGHKQKVETK